MTQIQHEVSYSVSQAPIPAYSNQAKQNWGVLILFVFIYTSVSQDFQKFWLKKNTIIHNQFKAKHDLYVSMSKSTTLNQMYQPYFGNVLLRKKVTFLFA